MTTRSRIGEILLMREWVDPWVLSQALRNPLPRMRLVSLLISRAQLDPDDGALALSEQLDYPAALTRHLERRDPATTELIPRELVARWHVVPLGRSRRGQLVTIASDPTPLLAAALEHAAKTPIALAVAPSLHVQRLIRSVYNMEASTEDVEIAEAPPPPVMDIEQIRPSIEIERANRRSRTVSRSYDLQESFDLPPLRGTTPTDGPLESTLDQMDRAVTLIAVERLAMAYAESHWHASLLLQRTDGMLLGTRGHGEVLGAPEAIEVPLDTPSIIKRAIDVRSATIEAPRSDLQQRLNQLLGSAPGNARAPAAAPIFFGARVEGALAVGDPRTPGLAGSLIELGRLADALSAAHDRFSRRPR